jgi:DNA-binding beta-propeller fold protein YncE
MKKIIFLFAIIMVSTFAGNGVPGFIEGSGTDAKFSGPRGIRIDAQGNIYVAAATNNRIWKITPSAMVSTRAGNGVFGYAIYPAVPVNLSNVFSH